MSERERLEFVAGRSGDKAADEFAEQTLAVYIHASIKLGPYKESIGECIRWLEEDGEYEVKVCVVRKVP